MKSAPTLDLAPSLVEVERKLAKILAKTEFSVMLVAQLVIRQTHRAVILIIVSLLELKSQKKIIRKLYE